MLAARTSTKESAMFHKSRYLTALAAGAVLGTLACSDRPTTSAPPPTPRTPGALASRTAQQLQAKSEALAQHLARALAHPHFRAYVKAQLDGSPFREHKLHFQRFLAADGALARDEDCGGGGSPPAPPPPPPAGLYMTQAHFVDDFEGWLKGAPEFEAHVLGQQGQTDSLTDFQCAGERQPAPYYFDQNALDWSGSVMLFSKAQIDAYNTAHPGQNPRVFVVEDDDTACEIKTDPNRIANLFKAVDGTYKALTAGNDSSSQAGKYWKLAQALQKLWSALASLINTNDELVGNAVQDAVVGEYYAGFNWIVKGEDNVTNGWIKLELH